MKKQTKQVFPCIYCGSMENPTDDHIPPKSLFPKPRPNNLITVPSCNSCNEGFHLDDDYFYMLMQTYIKTSEHPEMLKTKEKFIRSIHRKESAGFRKSILEKVSIHEISTESGIYLGNSPVLDVNWLRVERVIGRIVKGLFYRKKGIVLPLNCILQVKAIPDPKNEEEIELFKYLLKPFAIQKETILGNNVFSYRFIFHEKNDYQTEWLLAFYEKFLFLSSTFSET
jgi:hypothetical protein